MQNGPRDNDHESNTYDVKVVTTIANGTPLHDERPVVAPPNEALSQAEKSRKRDLKQFLRLSKREKRIRHRLRLAQEASDATAVQKATMELQETLDSLALIEQNLSQQKCLDHEVDTKDDDSNADATTPSRNYAMNKNPIADQIMQRARIHSERIHHALQKALSSYTNSSTTSSCMNTNIEKQEDSAQSRILLQHMTKGTQHRSDFTNLAALRGYTRTKFLERAILMQTALSRLVPYPFERDQTKSPSLTWTKNDSTDDNIGRLWKRIQQVDTVVSLGCGPGCDAVGIVGWYTSLEESFENGMVDNHASKSPKDCSPRTAILLDWAISDWQCPILITLHELIVPTYFDRVEYASCDVKLPWTDEANERARSFVNQHQRQSSNKSNGAVVTLFVTSYLLSETRGKWNHFFQQLWEDVAPGTLFLFTDPTAWQLRVWLHQIIIQEEKCPEDNIISYTWLDSSMFHPALQSLEKRVGPAALLAMKPLTTSSTV